MEKPTKVSLVLGSGAARGLAHIGVINYLEEHHYVIDYISGASMGALVGGIYAAGELDVYTRWVRELKGIDIIRLLDISFNKQSIFKGEKIIEVLKEIIQEHMIEALPIGFTAVATDVLEQKEIWLKQGSLFEAIRASIAVPMIFSPVQMEGRLLVDGGIINPVPIGPTLNNNTERTIAVTLNGPAEKLETNVKNKLNENNHEKNKYRLSIERFIESILPKNSKEKTSQDLDLFHLMTQSMDTMQNSISRFKLAANRPDIVIEIPRNICTWFDFDHADELIEFGYKRAEYTLQQYEMIEERRL